MCLGTRETGGSSRLEKGPGYTNDWHRDMFSTCKRVQSIPASVRTLDNNAQPIRTISPMIYNHLEGNLELQLIVEGVRQGYLHANRLSEDGAYRHLVLLQRIRRLDLRRGSS